MAFVWMSSVSRFRCVSGTYACWPFEDFPSWIRGLYPTHLSWSLWLQACQSRAKPDCDWPQLLRLSAARMVFPAASQSSPSAPVEPAFTAWSDERRLVPVRVDERSPWEGTNWAISHRPIWENNRCTHLTSSPCQEPGRGLLLGLMAAL